MKKSIQQTIKDCSKGLKAGIIERMLRWALITDGWSPTQADHMLRWAKVYVEKTKGQSDPYPDTTVITVEPDSIL